ncbi:TadE/TadG family type IV pilus assembly protein [Rhizobium paknamense]|uniref:Flp pilus assembly protein TadG n=1 Tax=Rhizobium paknamense TaxID=1206817 RepID=A0ABU0IBR7_9HYPH|nr:TadE/TadG family type IV pilus assembly protein [Rhizobium paknamense]MDQ0455137.1 Flp pilus assembly protein TadG [Rhizobium paknamense]
MEFALLVPVMLLLLAGTVDLGEALIVNRKIDKLATTLADVIAQESNWPSSDVDNVITGGTAIVTPFETSNLRIMIGVVHFDSNGNPLVSWTRAYRTDPLKSGTPWPYPLTGAIIDKSNELVAVHVEYNLTTSVSDLAKSFYGNGSYSFVRDAIFRPRISTTITNTG